MSLQNASLLIGPTISITGGTAQQFGVAGGTGAALGVKIVDTGEADPRTRDFIEFRAQNGTVQKDGSWSFDRRSVRVTSPELDALGVQQMPFAEAKFLCPPLLTATKMPRLKELLCQAIMDADFSAFYSAGSTS